ncbi:MAG: hypothetical protein ACI8RZ_004622 [Myxococcota bacterium]|jgi:hypothetical protein
MPSENPDPSGDVRRIQHALNRIERDAKKLPWSKERPWKTDTHVWAEDGLPVVDLHDLSVSLGRKVTDRVIKLTIGTGAVSFITGQGNHSVGPAQLKGAVSSILMKAVDNHDGWSFRPDGPGRYVLITDPSKAPRVAQTSLPVGFWILVAGFLAALMFAFLNNTFGWF